MSLRCEVAAPFVANSAVDGTDVALPFRGHVGSCLKCQARHSAMVKTARAMRAMSSEVASAPADLEWRVMSSLDGDLAISHNWRRPVALIAAGLSMAAAVVIWRFRPRPQG